jgi:hypothetical protein
MNDPRSPNAFHFVISGDLRDFAVFCAIIRGDDLTDEKKLVALTNALKQHTEKLVAAEATQPKP